MHLRLTVRPVLSPDLQGFITSGISLLVGTRDAALVPEATRGIGVRVEGADELTVFLPAATGARALANLRDNGRIAACFSRPRDHRTIQLKGRLAALREATERDRDDVERYVEALARTLHEFGVPLSVTRRFARWPAHAVRFRVEEVYLQTPGPGAGTPLTEDDR